MHFALKWLIERWHTNHQGTKVFMHFAQRILNGRWQTHHLSKKLMRFLGWPWIWLYKQQICRYEPSIFYNIPPHLEEYSRWRKIRNPYPKIITIPEVSKSSPADCKMKLTIITFVALVGAVLVSAQEKPPPAKERSASPQGEPVPPKERAASPQEPAPPADRAGE